MKHPAPVSESELHTYVDGQLPPDRRAAVEDYLADHPAEAERVRAWRLQNEQLHARFDTALDEPVDPALRPRSSTRRLPMARAAALLAAAVIGGVLGWALRGPGPVEITADLAQRAAIAHVVYSPEVLHPVEVGAREEAHLVAWLSKRLGAPVHAPRLADAGFELIGGRLLPDDRGPAAQFMYQDAHGARLTLYVRTAANDNRETAFRYVQEGPLGVFYWVDGPFGYALSGELERSRLLAIAEAVYRALNS